MSGGACDCPSGAGAVGVCGEEARECGQASHNTHKHLPIHMICLPQCRWVLRLRNLGRLHLELLGKFETLLTELHHLMSLGLPQVFLWGARSSAVTMKVHF